MFSHYEKVMEAAEVAMSVLKPASLRPIDYESWNQLELRQLGILHVDVTDNGITYSFPIDDVTFVCLVGELSSKRGPRSWGYVIVSESDLVFKIGTIRMKVMPERPLPADDDTRLVPTYRDPHGRCWSGRAALDAFREDVEASERSYVSKTEEDLCSRAQEVPTTDDFSVPSDEINPKDLAGAKKPSLSLFPPSATILGSEAMKDGAEKYGPYNWREKKIAAMEYVSAVKRHLDAWADGEELSRDSKVHHLGAALATVAIIIDAMTCGALKDDRPLPGAAADLIEKYTRD